MRCRHFQRETTPRPDLMTMKIAILNILVILLTDVFSACNYQSPVPVVRAETETKATEPIDAKISDALTLINEKPDVSRPYILLAALYIQKARSTGDFSLNSKAETAVATSLRLEPDGVAARKLQASLHLTYHRFDQALELGKQLQKDFPDDAFVYGILTDANVELGNYDEAVASAQRMVDLKPNAAAYARVGHLRSLYGDHKGSVEMFTTAARTSDPNDKEAQSWCLTQLADEYWKYGDYKNADRIYDEALQTLPAYYLAETGKARVQASLHNNASAIAILERTTSRIPNVEAQILLGSLYSVNNEPDKAKQAFDMVEVIEAKLAVNNDQKRLSLMWSDNGQRLDEALTIAERESAIRKDILTSDALAWALFKNGRYVDAKTAATAALRLNSNDARMLYHAGMIELALGNTSAGKQMLLRALKLNPQFDLVQAAIAQSTVAGLDRSKGTK